jgi:hypothetical protein
MFLATPFIVVGCLVVFGLVLLTGGSVFTPGIGRPDPQTPTPVDQEPFPPASYVQSAKQQVAASPQIAVTWIFVEKTSPTGHPEPVFAMPHLRTGALLWAQALHASLVAAGWTWFEVWAFECDFTADDLARIANGDMSPFYAGKCRAIWKKHNP